MKIVNCLTLPLIFGMICLASACTQNHAAEKPSSQPLDVAEKMEYDVHQCAWSGEMVKTVRYGAKASYQNNIHYFRSVEDLVYWIQAKPNTPSDAKLSVVDFIAGNKLLEVRDAVYLYSKLRPSPGGHHITALERNNTHMQDRVYDAYPGPMLSWNELLELLEDPK